MPAATPVPPPPSPPAILPQRSTRLGTPAKRLHDPLSYPESYPNTHATIPPPWDPALPQSPSESYPVPRPGSCWPRPLREDEQCPALVADFLIERLLCQFLRSLRIASRQP